MTESECSDVCNSICWRRSYGGVRKQHRAATTSYLARSGAPFSKSIARVDQRAVRRHGETLGVHARGTSPRTRSKADDAQHLIIIATCARSGSGAGSANQPRASSCPTAPRCCRRWRTLAGSRRRRRRRRRAQSPAQGPKTCVLARRRASVCTRARGRQQRAAPSAKGARARTVPEATSHLLTTVLP